MATKIKNSKFPGNDNRITLMLILKVGKQGSILAIIFNTNS